MREAASSAMRVGASLHRFGLGFRVLKSLLDRVGKTVRFVRTSVREAASLRRATLFSKHV